jgi:hypothetical protein
MRSTVTAALALALALPTMASANVFVYPKNGQSAQQQQRDEGECHTWAVGQTGFNPATASGGQATEGGVVRGGARGAATGAVIGAIAGNAGTGAAAGAAGGALIGGMRRRDAQRQQDSARAAGQNEYLRAFTACLEARGYSVN